TCYWENKYNEQCELTNEISTQYKLLKLNEDVLIAKLKEMTKLKECVFDELCSYKAAIEEKNDLVKTLNTNLKSIKEENCNLRRKINMNSRFGMDCKSTNEILDSIKQFETNSKSEQENLSTKFNIVCEKLYETKIAFCDVKNSINCDILNIGNTADVMKKLLEVENCKKSLLNQNQQLIYKNDLMEKELIGRNKKIKELKQKNDYYVNKINKMKKKLLDFNLKKDNVSCSIKKEFRTS
ncbi:hypothetical protein AGLY_015109, partial [Aphis glycines]